MDRYLHTVIAVALLCLLPVGGMADVLQPAVEPARWIVRHEGRIAIEGVTPVGDVTASGHVLVGGEGPNAYLEAVRPYAKEFPELPRTGLVVGGQTYDAGGVPVLCRRSHVRTGASPSPEDATDRYIIYKAEPHIVEWTAKEEVLRGEVRGYKGGKYRCLKAHTTRLDETPDRSELWAAVDAPPPKTDATER